MAEFEVGGVTEWQQQQKRGCEEEESGSIGSRKKRRREERGLNLDVTKKPRGRPPGSKNKAKPPVIISRDPDSTMRPHVMSVPPGFDIVQCLTDFTQRYQFGICVLTACGVVANVSLRQTTAPPAAVSSMVTLHGSFNLLSLTGAFLPPSSSIPSCGLSISMAGPQGQVVGGSVGGLLTAAGPVVIVAASFINPSYHNLSAGDEDECGNDNAAPSPPPPPPLHHQHHPPHHHPGLDFNGYTSSSASSREKVEFYIPAISMGTAWAP